MLLVRTIELPRYRLLRQLSALRYPIWIPTDHYREYVIQSIPEFESFILQKTIFFFFYFVIYL